MRSPYDTARQPTCNPDNYEPFAPRDNRFACMN
jgi:hypothetical protein